MTTSNSLRILLTLCVAAFVMNITNYMFYSNYSDKMRLPHYNKNQNNVCVDQTRPTEAAVGSVLLRKLIDAVRTKASEDTEATSCTALTTSSDYDTTTNRLVTSSTLNVLASSPLQ